MGSSSRETWSKIHQTLCWGVGMGARWPRPGVAHTGVLSQTRLLILPGGLCSPSLNCQVYPFLLLCGLSVSNGFMLQAALNWIYREMICFIGHECLLGGWKEGLKGPAAGVLSLDP